MFLGFLFLVRSLPYGANKTFSKAIGINSIIRNKRIILYIRGLALIIPGDRGKICFINQHIALIVSINSQSKQVIHECHRSVAASKSKHTPKGDC